MIDRLISLVAPHLCTSCGDIRAILCDNCKYNIVSEYSAACVLCGSICGTSNICSSCHPHFSRAFCVGERTDELRRVLDCYKFENAKAAYKILAKLLSERIGQLPSSVIIVPVPTIPSHIRQRGYDHTLLIAKELARLQGLSANSSILKRATFTQQRGSSKQQRIDQAKLAFKTKATLSGGTVLLIDDIVTTGASINCASEALLKAGADEVWIGVLAKQLMSNSDVKIVTRMAASNATMK